MRAVRDLGSETSFFTALNFLEKYRKEGLTSAVTGLA